MSVLVDVGWGLGDEEASKKFHTFSTQLARVVVALVSVLVAESAEECALFAPAAILLANSRHIFSKIVMSVTL